MSATASRPRLNWRLVSFLLVGAGALLFVGANVHLVHVALSSQPGCVEHLKTEGQDGAYRAAGSSC
ncbi:UNVERIFIED_ORG: hypothetical protein LHK14_22330 (plasmid) [Roseateles sp. XES5]|nr:hypothetical protein [Roseateles sp. XES5]